MPIPASWVVLESHVGEAIDQTNDYYKCVATAFVYVAEADRMEAYWNYTLVNTSGGVITITDLADGIWSKVQLVAYDTDPENCHEDLVDDIKTMQDALAANDTQVTQANTVTTGEIAVYAAGKITAVIGTP